MTPGHVTCHFVSSNLDEFAVDLHDHVACVFVSATFFTSSYLAYLIMSRQPLKKTKLSSLVRHDRPSTTLRIANVREVRFSTRGHVLEQRSRPIESRWHNWAAKDNEELGLDGYDENWELEPASALPAHEPGATLDEKGKRKRSQTAVR